MTRREAVILTAVSPVLCTGQEGKKPFAGLYFDNTLSEDVEKGQMCLLRFNVPAMPDTKIAQLEKALTRVSWEPWKIAYVGGYHLVPVVNLDDGSVIEHTVYVCRSAQRPYFRREVVRVEARGSMEDIQAIIDADIQGQRWRTEGDG